MVIIHKITEVYLYRITNEDQKNSHNRKNLNDMFKYKIFKRQLLQRLNM